MTSGAHKNLLDALAHLEHGDWQAAHDIVQRDESQEACWVHGIVHVLEGDLDNARYWYRRADRPFSPDTTVEIQAARQSLQ